MSQCQIIEPMSTYNAVNIKIHNPRANVAGKTQECNNGEFNAVNMEIINPELGQPIYSYPVHDSIVTSDMALAPVTVPEPNLTTVEDEKKNNGNPAFSGISFRASAPEIIPDANLKPAINIDEVNANLKSDNYDVQARQLEKIVKAALGDKESAIPYVTQSVFAEIINLAEKDTSALEGPTNEQIELRKKIITNEIIKERETAKGKKPEEIELPYNITKSDLAIAATLSPLEMAERNKEYALLTLAALGKVYVEEFENKTGNVVPLTDIPGASVIANSLRNSKNPSVKIAAIEALAYINRDEYKDEISAIMKIAATDENQLVSMVAKELLKSMKA